MSRDTKTAPGGASYGRPGGNLLGTAGEHDIPSGRWSIDAERSSVAFSMKHMLLATLNGRFDEFDGVLEVGADGARAAGTVKAGSIDTNEPVRDDHLRSSPDFFDVERHPEISFTSTRISSRESGHLQIVGALTMRGITREMELDGRLSALDGQPSGSTHETHDAARVQIALHGELNRKDFGLTWNSALETGGVLVGEDVTINLEVQFIKS